MVSKWTSIGNGVVAGVLCAGATIMAAPPDAAAPVLAKQHVFTDWAAACDNGGLCRAVSLHSPTDNRQSLMMVMTSSMDAKTPLQIDFFAPVVLKDQSSVSLFIDGAEILINTPIDKNGVFAVSGDEAIKVARQLALGKVATVRDAKGIITGTASLIGSSSAFRKLDVLQRKNGTRAALIARGRKPFRAKMHALPIILVERSGTEDATPDVSALVALAESSACAKNRSEVSEDRAYSLGNGGGVAKALVLIACGSSAYSTNSQVYIGQQKADKSWQFESAKIEQPAVLSEAADAPTSLINAEWDASKRILGSLMKARGTGDCGLSASYVWDGKMFRLVEATGMEECRGAPDWLPLWRATVKVAD
jgi:Protein of unknown function (DUF1176)